VGRLGTVGYKSRDRASVPSESSLMGSYPGGVIAVLFLGQSVLRMPAHGQAENEIADWRRRYLDKSAMTGLAGIFPTGQRTRKVVSQKRQGGRRVR
jgi:hypothetical protein